MINSVNRKDSIFIRYPVECSLISSANSITIVEEAPIAIGIKNISNRAIGINADYSRLLLLRLRHSDGVN
jgi:hypothetical protein